VVREATRSFNVREGRRTLSELWNFSTVLLLLFIGVSMIRQELMLRQILDSQERTIQHHRRAEEHLLGITPQ